MFTDEIPRAHLTTRHPHDDSPPTQDDFQRLSTLPEGPEHDELSDRLVTDWLSMAHRLADRYRDRGEEREDLRQVAALGLCKAVHRYDPARGAFASYAVPTINGELRRHFRDHTWGVHVPRRVQELRNRVRRVRHDLADVPGHHEPSVEEVARAAGLSCEETREGLEALDSYQPLSLSTSSHTDAPPLEDRIGVEENGFDLAVDREAARPGLRALPERQRAVLYLRYFRGMTQSQIGRRMGISQAHVSRLIDRACTTVRAQASGR
ncbi:SigB/SigF/SigG family RNA polymerase sigma factor [Streptomyces sp. NPDC004539]|uniref:SigB/SigF/SigG family RNA polymerase sigma factor n=1 Tax=Streptomyces sp. NPDC004539 TaxID=3154280 RepID=UPI0033A02F89